MYPSVRLSCSFLMPAVGQSSLPASKNQIASMLETDNFAHWPSCCTVPVPDRSVLLSMGNAKAALTQSRQLLQCWQIAAWIVSGAGGCPSASLPVAAVKPASKYGVSS